MHLCVHVLDLSKYGVILYQLYNSLCACCAGKYAGIVAAALFAGRFFGRLVPLNAC